MGRERSYVEQIRVLDRLGLIKLWGWLQASKPIDGWEEGKPFEYLILRAFELEDAQVIWPYFASRFEQIDGAVFVDGMLFSARGFTTPALEEASRHPTRNVLLWSATDITHALMTGMRAGLQRKWRKAVEKAAPDYDLKELEDA